MGFSESMVSDTASYSSGSNSGAMSVLSGVLGAVSELSKGKAAKIEAQQQAETARFNARLAGSSASIAKSEGSIAKSEAARAAYKAEGRTTAALAESGILGSATGASVVREGIGEAEREQSRLTRQARLNALQYEIEQSNYLSQAAGFEAQAKTSKNWLGAAGRLLGGVATGYDYARQSGGWFTTGK